MKRLSIIIIFCCTVGALFLSNSLYAQDKANFDKARLALDKIVKAGGISAQDLGLYVVKDGSVVYENHSNQKFIPASLSKLLTCIASLKVFSPEKRNSTELRSSSPIKDKTLEGPLYIKGNGDPSFISEQMWILVNNFVRNDITTIKGPIIVDSTVFDEKFFDDSRQKLRVDRAYDSPVSGLSFNWNTVNVYLRAGDKVGSPLEIHIDPENDYFTVINKTTTVSGNRPAAIVIDKAPDKNGEKIIVSGSMGIHQGEAVKFASITYPDLWVGKNLLQFLKQRGIVVENPKIVSQKAPEDSVILAEAKGWTFAEVIDGMMKFSNNFLAETITKNMVVQRTGKQGNIDDGVVLIRDILEKEYGLKKDNYDFISPSGFSDKNKISPSDLGNLLVHAYKDFSISSYLLSAMASPQSEGTLSKRMESLKEPRLVRAKTGLLSGVAGLAGYIAGAKGEVFTFVFIYNGKGREVQAKNLFDRLAMEMTRL